MLTLHVHCRPYFKSATLSLMYTHTWHEHLTALGDEASDIARQAAEQEISCCLVCPREAPFCVFSHAQGYFVSVRLCQRQRISCFARQDRPRESFDIYGFPFLSSCRTSFGTLQTRTLCCTYRTGRRRASTKATIGGLFSTAHGYVMVCARRNFSRIDHAITSGCRCWLCRTGTRRAMPRPTFGEGRPTLPVTTLTTPAPICIQVRFLICSQARLQFIDMSSTAPGGWLGYVDVI